MDKNNIIGIFLIGLLLIGYTWYTQPSEEELRARKAEREKAEAAEKDAAEAAAPFNESADLSDPQNRAEIAEIDSAAAAQITGREAEERRRKYGVLASAATGEEEFFTVRNERFEVTFTNKGGVPAEARLLKYNTYEGDPLMLFAKDRHSLGYFFTYPSLGRLHTGDFYFSVQTGKTEVLGDDRTQVVYTLATEDGRRIENIYTITGRDHDIGFETKFYNTGGIVTEPALRWELSGARLEKSVEAERNNSTVFYKEEGKSRDYLSESGSDDEQISNHLEWVAFKQNFFSAILMKEEGGAPFGKNAKLETRPYEEKNSADTLTQYYFAEIPASESGFKGRLFLGPNDFRTLRSYGMDIDRTINLGWGIFGWVNRFLVIPIFDWLEKFGISYGIIILILTIIIKTILAPLTWKNYLSSARMRVLKPEIDALNEKFKDADPMKKQQATMDLYRKTGVSPFAGCLPMLIQLPILYAMFRFFPNAIQLRQQSFLWADDLSSYDSIASLPFHIPAYGDHVSLFTLLMAASTFFYTMFNSSNMPTQTQPGMPNMKVIMYIFPFMMLFFFNSFASGLSYYYFLANLVSIIQMVLIKNFLIDEEKIKAKIAENKKKRGKLGKSKFQKKLEEMAKQRGK